ncbi:peptidoglycan-binding protein [Streptomyces sp. NPDC088794]|uniref:peptidoglycan-binding protein n=1 Tax=Streptomyces sp. NPDC088794 TaxID=3365902 RepID=UPI00382B93D8
MRTRKQGEKPGKTGKRRVVMAVLGASAAITGLSVLLVGTLSATDSSDGGDSGQGAHTTAEAAVRDLTLTQTLNGVVAYQNLRALSPGRSGVVTQLPQVDAQFGSGEVLMRIDDRPVVLLTGKVPAWRDLRPGMSDGTDVQELETALLALGYGTKGDGFPDGHWDARTTKAVEEFQGKTGAVVDGVVSLGDVVFAPGPIRVAKLDAHPGGPAVPGTSAMKVSDTVRVVMLDLDPLDRNLMKQGAPLEVEFPSGDKVAATVRSISTTLEMNADNKGVYKVTASLRKPSADTDLVLAPVTVHYTTVVAKDVLSVPATAIIGTPGGGYAVDVVSGNGGAHKRTSVQLGAWGDGFVAITGGVPAGTEVEVPK